MLRKSPTQLLSLGMAIACGGVTTPWERNQLARLREADQTGSPGGVSGPARIFIRSGRRWERGFLRGTWSQLHAVLARKEAGRN